MFFISLVKTRGELTPEFGKATEMALKTPSPDLKIHNVYWTLGEYDFVIIYEAPDEKAGLKAALPWAKYCTTQTMVAIPNEEATKIAFK
jgi:uncharacterized protein with GYD domain